MLPLVVLFPSCMLNHLRAPWKRRLGLCGPATEMRCAKRSGCQGQHTPGFSLNCRMGDAQLHLEKGAVQVVLCITKKKHKKKTTSAAVNSHPMVENLGLDPMLPAFTCSSCRVQLEGGMQEVHAHSLDFQLLVSGQHSGIKLELLP